MPAYGKVKVDTITYDLSGTATDVSVSNIATKASPTFTGTVTVPTPTAGDDSTKAASTAFVVASFATKVSPTFTGTVTVPTASANDNTTKAASTAYVQTELGDYALKASPAFTGTATGVNLTLSGDLTVNGTTTTINTTTLQVEDKNIEIGKVSSPSDTTADGGGWTLKGATDKTFNWVNSTDAWTSSEHIALAGGKSFQGNLTGNVTGNTSGSAGSCTGNAATATVASGLTGSPNVTVGTIGCGAITGTSTVSDSKGDLRKIIQNTQGSAYTLVAADAGKHILASGNITIPNSIFAAGDGVVIVNNTAGDLTITSTITNLYLGSDGSTGNKKLAGRCTCTVLFTAGTSGYISGGGLSAA